MPVQSTPQETGLVVAARARRRQFATRFVLACLTALVLSSIVGWTYTVAWIGAYSLVQALELWSFAPISGKGRDRLPTWRAGLGYLALFLNGAVFGALSIPLWLFGGALGGVCAALVISAAVINTVVNTPGSNSVLAAVIAPHVVYFLTIPIFMTYYGGTPAYASAALMGAAVFLANGVVLWRMLETTRRVETEARAASEAGRRAAEEAMAGKNAFIAAISHDLRTPLSAMTAGAAELERGAKDSTARTHAALIADGAAMMKALLDDLLDHSKLEAGRMTVEATPFDLRQLMAQVARFWGAEARKKGLKLRFEGAALTPAWIEGDPTRLRQILNNLISNAIKFTEDGAVTVRVAAWASDDDGVAVRFQVADTGQGMTREQLGRLFTPFDQTDEGVARRYGGTGLGLAISRDLARLMGGHLTAASVERRGSTFTLALTFRLAETPADAGSRPRLEPAPRPAPIMLTPLPLEPEQEFQLDLEPAAAEAEPQAEHEDEDEDGRPPRLLVVDDHEINRRAVQLILEPLGCVITTASHGRMALEIAASEPFDAIFMDVRMPEMDGRETTRRLRAGDGPNRDTPVIAVTADNGADDVKACHEAGMTHFVAKPLDATRLLAALTDALAAGAAQDADDADRQVA